MIKVIKTEAEWKKLLTRDEFRVLRQAHTEKPFSGKYNDFNEAGLYVCAACGTPLFDSSAKYDHGTGWPSFTAPVDGAHLEVRLDRSFGMTRAEVRCGACGSHLGHVFDDGPAPAGSHYCINSTAMHFRPVTKSRERTRDAGSSDSAADTAASAASALGAKAAHSKIATEIATFAAGCFWGVEDKFRNVRGVLRTRVGYTGGDVAEPTYEMVCTGETGHAEAVEVIFDPATVSYEQLLEFFFLFHDASQVDRQGPDVGRQYRSAIYTHGEKQRADALEMIATLNRSGRYDRPIATQVVAASPFFEAEPYHQQYKERIRKSL